MTSKLVRKGLIGPQIRAGLLGGILVLALGLVSDFSPARAQSDTQSLINKVNRLQRELIDLQRVVYQGAPPPSSESLSASGDLNQTQAARLELRLSQFESALQSLTGQIEDLGFAVDRINGRLDGLAEEVRARLEALERQASAGGLAGTAPAQGQTLATSSATPGTLGTIKQSDLQALQQSQPVAAQSVEPVETVSQSAALPDGSYQLPPGTPKEQYEFSFSLLRQANYEEARLALDAFVKQHPGDPLTGNAHYWLGETYYVQGDYNQAAVTFAEAFQGYPDGNKAPASLLKLGMSLSALGAKEDACGTFDELLRRFPSAQATVLQKAKSEKRSLSCP